MLTSSPPTSAPGTDKTGMDFRRILPEIRCQSCLARGSEPTPRGGFSPLSSSRASARLDRPRKPMVCPTRPCPNLSDSDKFAPVNHSFQKHSPPRFCQSLTNSASDPPPSPRSLPPGVQFKFMRQRSHLRNRLEYCVAILALKSLQWAPRNLAFALARVYTRCLLYTSPSPRD